jgi:uncharacterized Fe-S cluster-containing radical SAM superfamily protein
MRLFLWFFTVMILGASAQAQTLDQTFKDWSVFKHGTSCYIASAPKKSGGTFKKRGQPYLLIVSKGASADEVNASSGYPYAAKSEVVAVIGGRQFKLFTQGAVAWAYDAAQDVQLVNAMKQGNNVVVRGKSVRGTTSEDTYSLNGVSDAYARMKALCK